MEQYMGMNRPDIPIRIIETFPKTGRTWLKFLLGKYFSVMFDQEKFYMYRSWDFWQLLYDKGYIRHIPCVIHSTLGWWVPCNMIQFDRSFFKGREVMFLIRDPRDVVVSAYYYRNFGFENVYTPPSKSAAYYNVKKALREGKNLNLMTTPFDGTIDEFVRYDLGSLMSCVKAYNLWVENSNIFSSVDWIRYEDMVYDIKRELIRVIGFMGVEIDEDMVAETLNFCKFKKMQLYCKMSWGNNWGLSGDGKNKDTYKVREGGPGRWKKELGEEAVEYMNKYIMENLNDFYTWYKYGDNTIHNR